MRAQRPVVSPSGVINHLWVQYSETIRLECMCLISFAWQQGQHQLVMMANRDEFHQRPTAASHWWPEQPNMLAGKDLVAGGTWLGITENGYFAALTNVRQLPNDRQGQISRGHLVKDFLAQQADPMQYLEKIAKNQDDYDGFNLIVGNQHQCGYFSNHNGIEPQQLTPGIYGLSNASLDTPWPKTQYAKAQMQQAIFKGDVSPKLERTQPYPMEQQPDTGIGQPWETLLSSPFIISPNYGTRSSTLLSINDGQVRWQERSYDASGKEIERVHTSFEIK